MAGENCKAPMPEIGSAIVSGASASSNVAVMSSQPSVTERENTPKSNTR
jgi:hypothetical protein